MRGYHSRPTPSVLVPTTKALGNLYKCWAQNPTAKSPSPLELLTNYRIMGSSLCLGLQSRLYSICPAQICHQHLICCDFLPLSSSMTLSKSHYASPVVGKIKEQCPQALSTLAGGDSRKQRPDLPSHPSQHSLATSTHPSQYSLSTGSYTYPGQGGRSHAEGSGAWVLWPRSGVRTVSLRSLSLGSSLEPTQPLTHIANWIFA